MKKQSGKIIKRLGIMGGIFFAALLVYFALSFRSAEKSNTVYAAMDAPQLPVAYVMQDDGTRMNPMYAYVQDMGNEAARDAITVLPKDRQLVLSVDEYDNMVASASYEIRTLDLSQLIENGNIDTLTRADGALSFTLPIQNLIKKEQPYLLTVTLDTGEQALHYYTRILWSDHDYAKEMLAVATDFTKKTFDYDAARGLAQYLETSDTADNSDLSHVTLASSFSQLTWGDSGMEQDGALSVTLKECDGVMGEVQVRYRSKRTAADGSEEHFVNEDNFVLRYDPQRIFIMDFDRRTSEIFDAQQADFENGRLTLGVVNADEVQTAESPSGRFTAFQTNRELWRYDEDGKSCVRVFGYRTETDESGRSENPSHKLRILSCKNNGDIDFLVYGHVNRGRHEGYNGILYYTYDNSEDTVTENFFIPIARSFELIAYDAERLSYVNGDGMMHLFQQGGLYGIDTNSQEIITIASALDEGAFAASETNNRAAWQVGGIGSNESIVLVNLDTDESQELREANAYVRVLGFIGDDFVYGICAKEGADSAQEVRDLPLDEIRIIAPDGSVQSSYRREGLYLTDVQVDGTRVRLNLARRAEDGSLVKSGEDTIVANRVSDTDEEKLGYYADSQKRRVYFLSIRDIGNKKVRVRAPETISYENTSSLELNTENAKKDEVFYAYARGHFVGLTHKLGAAVTLVYGEQGYVTDSDQNLLWNRADRETIAAVKDPQDTAEAYMLNRLDGLGAYARYDDVILMDGTGLSVNQALYYVGKGMPVLAYNADGGSYLISAYDQFNITLINPLNGEKQLMGKNDAELYFEAQGKRFAVAVRVGS